MGNVVYWNHRLEKIQYALDIVKRILDGEEPSDWLNYLEKSEDEAVKDLIQAEKEEGE